MDGVFIRKYLTDRGFKNEDINYDPNSNSVTYKGTNLVNPDGINADGNSYTSQKNIDSAINNYDSTQRRNQQNAILDNLLQNSNNQTITPFKPTVQAPVSLPFMYNAASDPSYQAALASAKANAQVASKNAQEELNARGILNSTVTSDRLGQIQQGAYDNVSNNILPQLMQQAYQKYSDNYNRDYQKYSDQANQEYKAYTDQYNQGQDKYKNLQSLIPLISGINQQGLDNQYRDTAFNEQQKQNNWNAYLQSVGLTGNLGTGAKNDYSLLGGTDGAPSLQGQQYQDNKAQQTIDNSRADRQLNATIGNMTSDNIRQNAAAARAVGNEAQARLFDIWDRTGKAPAGITGVAEGTLINKGTPSGSTFNLDDYKGYVNNTFMKKEPIDPRLPMLGSKDVFDAEGARRYILGLNISPNEIAQMLQLYNLPLTTK